MTTTSDARGRFAFEHVSAGQYLVRASSRGRDEARTEPFRLDSDVANLELMLGDLGRLEGRVLGANGEQHERVRVFALPAEADISSLFRGNSRQMVTARPDGTYLFDRLKPGDYVVRATTGDGMRSLFREFLSGTPRAEVTVLANRTARLDVTVKIALTGTIRGSVTQNGMPGKGLRVSLVRQGGSLPDGPAPGPHLRNMSNRWSSSSNTVVGDNGEFERDELTVGTYQLTISAGRRSGALHSETVMVSANEISLVSIALVTAAIRGQITTDDGSSPDQLSGSLMLLPNLTELPGDLDAWRRDNQTFNARVSEGRFEVAALPPGIYLAVLTVRGHERTTAQVAANLGPPQPVQIPVGRKTESGNGR